MKTTISISSSGEIQQPATKLFENGPILLTMMILGVELLLTTATSAQAVLGPTGTYGVMGGGVVTVVGGDANITGYLGSGSMVGSVTHVGAGTQVTPITEQNIADFNPVYAALTGNLILDAQLQTHAVWVLAMGPTFNTTGNSSGTVINSVGDSVANYGDFRTVSGAAVFVASTMFLANLLDESTIKFEK